MKKAIFFIVIIASILIINSLVHSIVDLWQKRGYVTSAENRLEKARKENKELKSRLEEVKSKDFIEEETRNKLFMGKEGESEIIISQNLFKLDSKPQVKKEIPNWEKWWDLFF